MLQKSVSQRAVHRAIALSGICTSNHLVLNQPIYISHMTVVTAAVLSVLVEPDTFPIVFIVYPIAVMLLSAFIKFVLHTRASFDLYFYFLLCMVDVSSLSLEAVVAQGSTAVVLRGRLQHTLLRIPQPVAIKLYTTLFVTDDEVHLFSKETACNAPEMIIGGNTKSAVYGPAADVYSLTVTLWHILVPGEAPWRGRSHFDVYTEIIQGQRPRLPPDLPPGCIELLESGWCPQPHDRQPIDVMVQRVLELYRPFAQQDMAPRQVNRSASKRRSSVLASSFLSKQNTTPPESE
ncbi:hypothetical protein DYB37_000056 [Aphanomyces astaci]|uniref:Protein kinase domain-containing protein n=1 Tax=Aphanomyces astaci TaxID=112090 RepID=A0A3R6ZAK7_APHAT|nr:hypothetical protein DYB35_006906 [Aphanomyces astaci]RHZ34529.1 hypothetical protein DYB37_000056 [Aphanomyces astaci]